jgi:hypothetical protein
VVSLVASLAGQEAQPLPVGVDLGGKTGPDKKGKKVWCERSLNHYTETRDSVVM